MGDNLYLNPKLQTTDQVEPGEFEVAPTYFSGTLRGESKTPDPKEVDAVGLKLTQ